MKNFLKRYYLDFNSKAGRKEFWLTTLTVFLILSLMSFLDYLLATNIYSSMGYLFFFFVIILILPFSSTMTRRLHDTNRKGIFTNAFFAINIIFIFLLNYGLHCNDKKEFLIYTLISVFILTFFNVFLIIILCGKSVLPPPIYDEPNTEEKPKEEIKEEVKADIINQLNDFTIDE